MSVYVLYSRRYIAQTETPPHRETLATQRTVPFRPPVLPPPIGLGHPFQR